MKEQENLVISYRKMRKIVGLIAILLPISLIVVNWFVNTLNFLNRDWWVLTNCQCNYIPNKCLKQSISHFYYTVSGELFVGALCAVAFFMFCYRGYPKPNKTKGKLILVPADNVMTNLAGLCALGVAIFPTGNDNKCISDNVRTYISSINTGYIHFAFAASLFLILAIISIVNFRRTKDVKDFGTNYSHPFFKLCGYIILACIIGIFIFQKFIEKPYSNSTVTFWLEALASQAFGWTWLVKGKIENNFLVKKIKNIVNPSKII